MRKIAVVGSRDYRRLDLVERFVRRLAPGADYTIVSGGARGVDRKAEDTARAVGLPVLILLADWGLWGRSAGMRRNTRIVEEADEIVAFWDGESRGTEDTILKGRAAGKPVTVFGPDGELVPVNDISEEPK